jgi:HSP20 family protein
MANLTRSRNSLDEMFDFRRDFEGLLNRLLASNALSSSRGTARLATAPPIEARVDNRDQKYHLKIALPGVKPSEVQINLQGDTLAVSGEHKTEEEKKNSNYVNKEFSYERFERVVTLPDGLDIEKLTAEFNNGCWRFQRRFLPQHCRGRLK